MALGRNRKRPQTEKNRKSKQRKNQWRLQRNKRRVAQQQQKAFDEIIREIDALEVLEKFDRRVNNRLSVHTAHSDENEHIEAEENGKFEVVARLDKLENQLICRRDRSGSGGAERMTINARLQAVKRIRAAYDKWSNAQQPPKKVVRKLKKRKLQHKKNNNQDTKSNNHTSVPNSNEQQLVSDIVPNPMHNNAIIAPLPGGNAMDAGIDDNANIFYALGCFCQ
ncbi:MAG: hypothetical protein GY782_04625 [Gammaproteobacteria bacterium]|nr:hypothetical protein [Gammaproteobacteria bacterium]